MAKSDMQFGHNYNVKKAYGKAEGGRDFGIRPGKPDNWGSGSTPGFGEEWANATIIHKGVKFRNDGKGGKGEIDQEFYESGPYFEWKKSAGVKNANSKKELRDYANWVAKEKGIDIFKQYGDVQQKAGEEEEKFKYNVREYDTEVPEWDPQELDDLSSNKRVFDKYDQNIDNATRQKERLDKGIADITQLKIPKVNPVSNVKSAYKGMFNQLKVRNKQAKAESKDNPTTRLKVKQPKLQSYKGKVENPLKEERSKSVRGKRLNRCPKMV